MVVLSSYDRSRFPCFMGINTRHKGFCLILLLGSEGEGGVPYIHHGIGTSQKAPASSNAITNTNTTSSKCSTDGSARRRTKKAEKKKEKILGDSLDLSKRRIWLLWTFDERAGG